MPDSPSRTGQLIAYAIVIASAVLLVCALLVVLIFDDEIGLGSSASKAEQTPVVIDQHTFTVAIEDFRYSPEDLTVDVGTTIIWTNFDTAPHDATERDRGWNTELLNERFESDLITVDEPGTFEYFCTIHPWMEATITVQERTGG